MDCGLGMAQGCAGGNVDRVLVNCENRFLKGLLLRLLVEVGLDVAEATDEEDVKLKMNLFGSSIILYVMEVTSRNRDRLYSEVQRLKTGKNPYSGNIIALVPNDSAEMVGGALKAGIGDVILLPAQRERHHAILSERIQAVTESIRRRKASAVLEQEEAEPVEPSFEEGISIRSELLREIKMANRGGHTVSFLMVRSIGLGEAEIKRFTEELSESLRDTDLLAEYDRSAFVVICPFTAKPSLVEVERKVHHAYAKLFGDFTKERRAFLYGANYPSEERDVEKLLMRMENGIHDSMAFTAIREPLRKLSPTEMEQFRRKLKLYRL